MWTILDPAERKLVSLLMDALADGLLEGDAAWDRYRTAVDALLPEVRMGTLTVTEVHEAALRMASQASP